MSRTHSRDPPPPSQPVTPSLEDIEEVFLALSHEVRRHVLLVLSHLGGELPSGYLAARFQHSWPTTSRHLRLLEKAGLVEVRREGRTSRYRLNRERLLRVVSGWLRHLDPVGPDKTWASSGPKSTGELREKPRTAPEARPETKPEATTEAKKNKNKKKKETEKPR